MAVWKKYGKLNLLTQMTLLIIVVILISTILVSVLFSFMVDNVVKQYVGEKALTVAELAAQNEEIIEAFDDDNPSIVIQQISEQIQRTTDADYVTIANRQNIRYSHYNKDNIGKPTATSNAPVFEQGKPIIYSGEGISGPAIKAKAPIFNKQGDVIGVSSVGFLINNVEKDIDNYQHKLIQLASIPLMVGCSGAILIARRLKKLTFGLEPEEIAFMFKEKEATLESIADATITVNIAKKITSMNKRARELFADESLMMNSIITDERLNYYIDQVIASNHPHTNQKLLIDRNLYVLDAAPISSKKRVKGIVLTVRPLSEIKQLTNEFSKINDFTENMRAQNHEFLNKMNTIYGLLMLKEYDRALKIVSNEVSERQDIISFLITSVKDPLIAACLLGKVNRAKELYVQLVIDEDSRLDAVFDEEKSNHFVPLIGNVIENAVEAARAYSGQHAQVKVAFTDLGKDIIFDIEDNGPGVPTELEEHIFQTGFTSKQGENHGLGLAIVKNALEVLNGQIYIDKSELGGARFTIVIPQEILIQ
ncbi:sensor histidine kinase [Lysinibacillus sp. FSL K6-0232]|uniref:sensor histidine kinase n=1 Tax=Lysinibacillus sp. FSL K6-0232 TaxID=2921425 RepID=UPI0030FB149F